MAITKPSIKNKSSWVSILLIVVLGGALLLVKNCKQSSGKPTPKNNSNQATTDNYSGRGLNRNPSNINYSKHARCRMDCRHINEKEIRYILENGKINYAKSELDAADCKKKYAVEGTTNDKQKVRIIFAPCNSEITVVTVIDLGQDWECACE